MKGLDKDFCIKWCNDNTEILTKHRSRFIAVCPKRGVLVSETNEHEFLRVLSNVVPKHERCSIFVTHTSEFVRDELTPREARTIKKNSALGEKDKIRIEKWFTKRSKYDKLTIVLDFDEVVYPSLANLNSDMLEEKAKEGSIEFIKKVAPFYKLVITSLRAAHDKGELAIRKYLGLRGINAKYIDGIKVSSKQENGTFVIDNLNKFGGKFPTLEELDIML